MPCWLYSVIPMQAFEPSTLYFFWLCILSMICISRTCFISCWDYIRITYIHEDDKDITNFNHLSQKVNLKHIILSEPFLSLFIFSLLYSCMSLNFIYVFLFPWPRISRAYTCDISWNYGWKLCEKKEEVMLDEKMGKVAEGEKKNKKERKKKRKKCSFMFLRFYVERAWNQKKLSIGD